MVQAPPKRRATDLAERALTEREWEIAALVADGLGNKAIAARLTLSENTVHTHLTRMMAKLHVPTRVGVALAVRQRRHEQDAKPTAEPVATLEPEPEPELPAPPPTAWHQLLTPRERDVLELVVQGLTTKELSARLNLAQVTVKKHIESICAKADVPSRARLIVAVLGARAIPRTSLERDYVVLAARLLVETGQALERAARM